MKITMTLVASILLLSASPSFAHGNCPGVAEKAAQQAYEKQYGHQALVNAHETFKSSESGTETWSVTVGEFFFGEYFDYANYEVEIAQKTCEILSLVPIKYAN